MQVCPDCGKRFDEGDPDRLIFRMFPEHDDILDPQKMGKCLGCWTVAAIELKRNLDRDARSSSK